MPKTIVAQDDAPASLVGKLSKRLAQRGADPQSEASRKAIRETAAQVREILKKRISAVERLKKAPADAEVEIEKARQELSDLQENESKTRAIYTEIAGITAEIADREAKLDELNARAEASEDLLSAEINEFADDLQKILIEFKMGAACANLNKALEPFFEDGEVPDNIINQIPVLGYGMRRAGFLCSPAAPGITRARIIIGAVDRALATEK